MSTAQETAMQEFFAESEEIIQRVSQLLATAESQGLGQDAVDSLYRDVHTLKGTAQLFGFATIAVVAHGLEAAFEPVRQKRLALERKIIDASLECLDFILRILKNPSWEMQKSPSLTLEASILIPKLTAVVTQAMERGHFVVRDEEPRDDAEFSAIDARSITVEPTQGERLDAPLAGGASEAAPAPSNHDKRKPIMEKPADEVSLESSSIRVNVNLLDRLMNLVGEMVLTRNQVLQYARRSEDGDFHKLTQRLDLLTSELQDNVMRTRMQPIGSVFSKFQRLVRDLARDLEKSIDLTIAGAETELDKSLIEAIKDPLTHIVRNSCDHGIEDVAQRRRRGKSDTGRISLNAYHEGGQMIIEIRDDGAGLDPQRLREKAIGKGILSVDRVSQLTDQQAKELIFLPGFSTAESVSSVSGRGVGMDVVKTNIERVGGVVELESNPSQFTIIRLRIPLTLAIVPAMIISCDQETYAIPQVKLQELLRIDLDEGDIIERVQGQLVYRLRDQLLPLIGLRALLRKDLPHDQRVFNIVVLSAEHHSYGLIVDEIRDTADIVVKPLPSFLKKVELFSGATIMGDGSVALIVDTQGVSDQVLGAGKASASTVAQEKTPPVDSFSGSTTEYLVVQIGAADFCIPLTLVNRLEEFKMKDIDRSADELLTRYRGGLLPIVDVPKLLGASSLAASTTDLPVVVFSKNNRLYGLAVTQINDLMRTSNEVIEPVRPHAGIIGTVLAPTGKVLTVLDIFAIIALATGEPVLMPGKAQKKVHVLLAEDTHFFARQIERVLQTAGHQVTHAENGEAAWKLLSEAPADRFGFVVSDIEMPQLDGFGLIERIRRDDRLRHLPVVALTTRFREADQERGRASGFDRYLEKLRSDELLQTINDLLRSRS